MTRPRHDITPRDELAARRTPAKPRQGCLGIMFAIAFVIVILYYIGAFIYD